MLWQVDVIMVLEVINYSYINKGHALETMYKLLNSLIFSVYFSPVNSQITYNSQVTFINTLCYTY